MILNIKTETTDLNLEVVSVYYDGHELLYAPEQPRGIFSYKDQSLFYY